MGELFNNMFENLCTLPLTSELFAQALHPTEPILSVGLSSGHVQSFRLPAAATSDDADADMSVVSTGTSTIDTEWRTRRHKGSCRTLGYSHDGEVLYSAGTDSLLKVANSTTGQVISKILIPSTSSPDPPTLLHALSPQTLLLATDSAALHLYDIRDSSTFKTGRPAQTHYPHDDYISSLTPLPPTEMSTSGFSKQWITTGATTLAVTDLRRGVLVKSEDQEEELVSSCFVSGLPSKGGRGREKVLVGSGSGVITLWEKGVWDDQSERIIVDGSGKAGGESLDAMVVLPDEVGAFGGKCVVVGCGDGTVRIVKVGGMRGVVEELRHDEIESVVAVGVDVEGRLISGGGETVKVWQQKVEDEEEAEAEEAEEEDERDGEDGGDKDEARKRALDKDSDADEDSSDEEGGGRNKSQKKKRAKKGQVGNGILGFKGME
ncbi:WD repeat-containing protein jip5 [Clarireedia jacksonii]